MSLTHRLRSWAFAVDAVPASDLMDEAANEIDRLRLTDEEREAIRNVLHHIATKADYLQREDYHLRSLLERTK